MATIRSWRWLAAICREELSGAVGPARLSALLGALLPDASLHRLRTAALRRCGWHIGHGSLLASVPRLSGTGPILERLTVGSGVYVNVGCRWDLDERIVIGDRVSLGHEVLLVTSTHRLGDHRRRAAELDPAPIRIGAGSWIGARATILPGVTIGAGAVVAAGSVVRRDVPPDSVFAPAPGGVIRRLDDRVTGSEGDG